MSLATGGRAGGAIADPDRRSLDILRRHGDHTSAFLAFNQDTRHYTPADIDGLVAYRAAGRRHLFQLCGPFAAPQDRERLLGSFRAWARSQGRRVTAVQLGRDDALMYANHGFVVNQLGSSYSIDLERFTLRGTKFLKTRNKISRARRIGVTVEELRPEDLDRSEIERELADIDAGWLSGKGRHAKELTFMVGERGGRGRPFRRVFVARAEGRAVAYVTYSPCFGERPGWLYDLTRRRADSPPGVIELVFHTALELLRSEGCRWLHLGLTPLVGLSPEHEAPGASSSVVQWLVSQLSARGEAIYPARSQEAFKLKWAPQLIEPEYVAFEGRPRPSAVWRLMRMTRAI
ncbi:MAG: DUF2156 domain-containing protein [Actinomycetota bacterium]|nr:DUF2156 domain-containing protein [Actinomycetota bacterium]